MKFGEFRLDEVQGAILAHSLKLPSGEKLKKGTVIDDVVLAALRENSVDAVIAAIPEPGDVLENDAATHIARKLEHPTLRFDTAKTGRVNIFAKENGIFRVSSSAIDAINMLDPGITLATLNDKEEVNAGRMIATIKIIPYGVEGKTLGALDELDLECALSVAGFSALRVALIQTQLAGIKPGVLDKTKRMLERRLMFSGSVVSEELRIDHTMVAVSQAISRVKHNSDLIILFGASANSDVEDVIPAGLVNADGEVIRFGMPVDPGNLLLLGEIDNIPVIGAPGCARSPAENGFDWVLQQILAGASPRKIHIAGMGVGGLLMETGARPHPRLGTDTRSTKTTAIVLAAGQSRRMGAVNKMTVAVHKKPMVRHVAEAALTSKVDEVLVVTGHKPQEIRQALTGLNVSFVQNDRFAEGLSTSLSTGIEALSSDTNQALILLGDMPFVTSDMIDQILLAEKPSGGIAMATCEGKRGNPVLWPAQFFEELTRIEGDTGARHVIGANADQVTEVEIGPAAAVDLDTPEAVAAAQRLE